MTQEYVHINHRKSDYRKKTCIHNLLALSQINTSLTSEQALTTLGKIFPFKIGEQIL